MHIHFLVDTKLKNKASLHITIFLWRLLFITELLHRSHPLKCFTDFIFLIHFTPDILRSPTCYSTIFDLVLLFNLSILVDSILFQSVVLFRVVVVLSPVLPTLRVHCSVTILMLLFLSVSRLDTCPIHIHCLLPISDLMFEILAISFTLRFDV